MTNQTKEREVMVEVCIGHLDAIIDRCQYCHKDEWNIHCECYRGVPEIHYINEIIDDEE